MRQYLDMLQHIRTNGKYKLDRTGVGCYSVFGYQLRFNLQEGFPLVTTKKLYHRAIVHELLWFLRGSTDNKELEAVNVKIWDDWAQKEDDFEMVRLSEYDRVVAGAELHGLTTIELQDRITNGWREAASTAKVAAMGRDEKMQSCLEFGHALLDEMNVPRERKRIIKARGELGPIYGKQWRSWRGADGRVHDQIANAIELLKTDPASRRNVISAWNVGELDQMHLNPCHALFQFYAEELTSDERVDLYNAKVNQERAAYEKDRDVLDFEMIRWAFQAKGTNTAWTGETIGELLDSNQIPKHRLSCQLYQRSADSFLGVPFNIASYALLTHMIAQVCNMAVGDFVHTFGDLHIYANHLEQVELQLSREPLPLPKLELNASIADINDFTFDDIKIVGYESHPAIKADVAV